ncbi:MAG: PD-(D/E)XK nuclease family protein [Anaerolineales bacterium]|nr:PD-(D/E)XK nuclease family protein [Anaerolineales bacterium]
MTYDALPPLTRGRLETFLACQRRFQLRYLERLPWPEPPLAATLALAARHGQQFHQLLAQHFLGLEPAPGQDEDLGRWWQAFQRQGPTLPAGDQLPEVTLTIPLGQQRLTGRFDLVIRTPDRLYLYDWKTEQQPRPAQILRQDWQTRLYLLLAVNGSAALGGQLYRPEQVSLTYWFAQAPEKTVTFSYTSAEHDQQEAVLRALITQLDEQLADGELIWPLTDNLNLCGPCPYQIYCGRQDVATNGPVPVEMAEGWLDADEDAGPDSSLEPTWS